MVAYGIVPLALLVNQYVRALTVSLTSSLTRFYSVSIEQNKTDEASSYLSTAFIVITLIVVFLSPFLTWIVFDVEKIFNIPSEFLSEAKLLFMYTFFGFILSLYSSLINITLYAKNRLDALNIIGISRLVGKVFLTVSFFEIISKQVSYIGFANFIIEIIVLLISLFYFKSTLNSKVQISYKNYSKIALFSMLSMAIWVMIQQFGDLALFRIDTILVNKFYTTRETGIIGAISEFGTYILIVATVISSLFGPLILIAYSKKDHKRVTKMTIRSSLWVGIFTSLIVGVLIGFAEPILNFWLGIEYGSYSNWLILKVISFPFYISAGIFSFVFRSWNKIIVPALFTLLMGILNFVFCFYILSFSDGREIYITYTLVISSLFLFFQSYVFHSYWISKIYPGLTKEIFKGLLKICCALIITSFLSFTYYKFFNINELIDLVLGLILVTSIAVLLLFILLIQPHEKKFLIKYFRFFISNIK